MRIALVLCMSKQANKTENTTGANQLTDTGNRFTLVDYRDKLSGEIIATDVQITNSALAKHYHDFKVFVEKARKNKIVEI